MRKFLLRRLGVADDPGAFKPTLQACLEAVLEQSDALADEVLHGLAALLLPTQAKALKSSLSPDARQAIEALAGNADVFKKSFAAALRVAVYGGEAQRGMSKPLVRFDDFQFLEEEQIDANIELAMTQQEVNLAVDDVLPNLNALISTLMGLVTVNGLLNPLKPESFVYALREAFVQRIPNDTTRSTVIALAAGRLGVGLRQLYKEVADWLRSQGVEPARTAVAAIGGVGVPTKPVENTVSRTMLTLDKLRRLLSGELGSSPAADGTKEFLHTIPASYDALQDMKLLEPMMKRLSDRAIKAASEKSVAASKERQSEGVEREPTQGKKLGRQLGEEVVRLMLENLMQDRRLLHKVRNALKAMEPILLKLSQEDPRFFSERAHPARQLLEKMTHRSLAFSSESEPGYARFLKSFEDAIQILSSGDGDAGAFARVLNTLEEVWNREELEQRQRAEAAARDLLHAEQRNLLAERIAQDFAARIQGKKIPDMVSNFLRGPWAQVVAEAQLRIKDSGVNPDECLALVDDLLWSVQLKLARRNRTRLVELVPPMLVKLRQGLRLIGYPEERAATFFDELIALHEKAFEGGRSTSAQHADATDSKAPESVMDSAMPHDSAHSQDAMDSSLWTADNEDSNLGRLDDISDIQLDFTGQAEQPVFVDPREWSTQSLNTGSWVDLALGGVWVRAQLTWASPHRTLFMFISGGGMAHSMSRRTMERLRGQGLVRLISDGRVMDNALDAVAQAALRNDIEKAGGGQ